MKYCKYCGKKFFENESCSCPKSIAAKKRPLFITLGICAIVAIVIAVVIIVAKGTEATNTPTPDTSNGTLQSTDTTTESPSESESAVNPSDTSEQSETETNITTEPEPAHMVDPFDAYITALTFDGHHGTGTATAVTNGDALIIQLIGEEPASDDEEAFDAWLKQYLVYDEHVSNITIEISPNHNLSNGDEVAVSVTVPDFLADKVLNTSKTYNVSGLPELQQVDVLSLLDITISGISGYATARIDRPSEYDFLRDIDYSVSPSSFNLSNGDEFTVTLTDASIRHLADKYNIMPTATVRTKTVVGLDEYVSSPDQLPASIVLDIADRYLAEVEENYDGYGMFTADTFRAEGIYWLTQKEESLTYGKAKTQLVFVVSYIEYNIYGETDGPKYFCRTYTDLTIDPDGVVDLAYENGTPTAFTIEQLEASYNVTKIG